MHNKLLKDLRIIWADNRSIALPLLCAVLLFICGLGAIWDGIQNHHRLCHIQDELAQVTCLYLTKSWFNQVETGVLMLACAVMLVMVAKNDLQ